MAFNGINAIIRQHTGRWLSLRHATYFFTYFFHKNYDRDYVDKPREYADRRIPEFWLVDPSRNWVKVLRLEGESYQVKQYMGTDALTSGRSETIVSPTFPDLKLTAAQVLVGKRVV